MTESLTIGLLPEWLFHHIHRLSKEELIEVLGDALDLMSQSNSRSATYCIAVASGYVAVGDNETGGCKYIKKRRR